jgi:MtN3 and saliva related transmembrane protein
MSAIVSSGYFSGPHAADHLGYVAGLITVGAFLPQVVRAWRTRQTRDLSLSTFALLVTAGSLWVVYGAIARDWPVVATNAGMVTLNLALAAAKLRFDRA